MRLKEIETEDGVFLRVIKPCKSCGDPFSYSKEEEKWLKNKGLAPFERCLICRKARREQNGK